MWFIARLRRVGNRELAYKRIYRGDKSNKDEDTVPGKNTLNKHSDPELLKLPKYSYITLLEICF